MIGLAGASKRNRHHRAARTAIVISLVGIVAAFTTGHRAVTADNRCADNRRRPFIAEAPECTPLRVRRRIAVAAEGEGSDPLDDEQHSARRRSADRNVVITGRQDPNVGLQPRHQCGARSATSRIVVVRRRRFRAAAAVKVEDRVPIAPLGIDVVDGADHHIERDVGRKDEPVDIFVRLDRERGAGETADELEPHCTIARVRLVDFGHTRHTGVAAPRPGRIASTSAGVEQPTLQRVPDRIIGAAVDGVRSASGLAHRTIIEQVTATGRDRIAVDPASINADSTAVRGRRRAMHRRISRRRSGVGIPARKRVLLGLGHGEVRASGLARRFIGAEYIRAVGGHSRAVADAIVGEPVDAPARRIIASKQGMITVVWRRAAPGETSPDAVRVDSAP